MTLVIKFLKPWGYVLMAFVFSIMSVFPSFASLATASDATLSDADIMDEDFFLDENFVDDPYGIDAYTDAAPTNFRVIADVVDSSGKWVSSVTATYKGSNSNYYQFSWPVLSNGRKYNAIHVQVLKKDLPSPGVYGVKSVISPYNLGLDVSSVSIQAHAYKSGVKLKVNASSGSYSNYTATGNIEIGYSTSLVVVVYSLKLLMTLLMFRFLKRILVLLRLISKLVIQSFPLTLQTALPTPVTSQHLTLLRLPRIPHP